MHQMSYWYLIVRYPTLRMFINDCYVYGKESELVDFIFNIETEKDPRNV